MSKRPQTAFTPFSDAYCLTIWQWRNQARIREQMRNTDNISWEAHQHWFHGALADASRLDFIMLQGQRPIGVLNFTQVSQPHWEWGCYLGETNVWPGSGLLLEVAALDYALIHNACQQLFAEVKNTNKGPLALHKLFEYECVPSNKPDYAAFTYTRKSWQQDRTRILSKLPKPHQEAVQNINFT